MLRRWILGLVAGLILSLFSLYPQFNLQTLRGAGFNGAFASCDLDEMAYAAFLQGLIDGRPRKSDPYTGRDSTHDDPQSESLFSIQFLPAYIAAIPARVFGLTASQMMPVISFLSAFFTALALYWLMLSMTDDPLLSMAGTMIVIVGGAAVTGIGALNGFFEGGVAYPFFPFLRRPIPSLAFPFLFAFFACIWKGINAEDTKWKWTYIVVSAILFASLVYSYFYLWTSAAAVLAGLLLFSFLVRSNDRRRYVIYLLQAAALCAVSLAPYAWLLSNRNKMADKAQLLVFTHEPDLTRTIEIIGIAGLVLILILFWRRIAANDAGKTAVVSALLLSPILVFNQQILTGRSLQPFHYEFYSTNYVLLAGVVLLVSMLWQKFLSPAKVLSRSVLIAIVLASVVWGYIEASETTKFWDDVNVQRDEAMPVNMRLSALAGHDIERAKAETTLNLESLQADSQPTVAPQGVLWARHQHTFAGVASWEENRERYYKLLYYSGIDGRKLRSSLIGCEDIEACMALFGWDRFNATLSSNARPLTIGEIDAEAANFNEFSRNFSSGNAYEPLLSYLVVYTAANNRLDNVDRWYERDGGEAIGKYTLYRLTPRSQN